MFDYKYLTREHLEGFDNYKYMAIDTSPLSVYVMHPFWNKVVELVPRWVAPNVLTFAGFLLTVANFLLLSHYDYDYTAASAVNATAAVVNGGVRNVIPGWLWPVLAVFLFLAYTLDGIDGKQARRTQTSGPLGEMFDHGLDSYSVFFIPACLYSIFGKGDFSAPPIRMYYIIWNILVSFYFSHWEKYNTGVLYLPWGYDFSMWDKNPCFGRHVKPSQRPSGGLKTSDSRVAQLPDNSLSTSLLVLRSTNPHLASVVD
ncbi:unnamed protein product [Plutella xylostella]|uniref:(diamondback moth) hypothetical protein n=1 Tax=Plutella xylostella TaxID=51655 RepID=A0A8S4FTC4_PLUXY|nr:unnamed protein product [Plutella xylostella]